MNTITAILIAVCLLLIYYDIYRRENYVAYTSGKNNTYQMVDKYKDVKQAADLLDLINDKIIFFLKKLSDKYLVYCDSDGRTFTYNEIVLNGKDLADYSTVYPEHLVDIVLRILSNYNPDVIIENAPGGKDTSYTVNKGQKLYICVRDAGTNAIVNYNLVMFVVLHELSHMGNKGWNHNTKDFWPIFKFILREAIIFGIYKHEDYEKHPRTYCGMKITYNPLDDELLPNIWELSYWNPWG